MNEVQVIFIDLYCNFFGGIMEGTPLYLRVLHRRKRDVAVDLLLRV
jgi:hypothetical protein